VFTYELLAVLLPGAVVLAVLVQEYALVVPGATLGAIAGAYVIGIVLQGVADFGLKREWIAKRLGNESAWKESAAYALGLIRRTLEDVPERAALDICLTHVGAGRVVYDKFVALRDTARGLALATLVASVSIIVERDAAESPSRPVAIKRIATSRCLQRECTRPRSSDRHQRASGGSAHLIPRSKTSLSHAHETGPGSAPQPQIENFMLTQRRGCLTDHVERLHISCRKLTGLVVFFGQRPTSTLLLLA